MIMNFIYFLMILFLMFYINCGGIMYLSLIDDPLCYSNHYKYILFIFLLGPLAWIFCIINYIIKLSLPILDKIMDWFEE